jgi:hypothetical protein
MTYRIASTRTATGAALALTLLHAAALAQTPAALTWPEAIARLAAERTRAVSCVEQARALGILVIDPLARQYGDAKAEVDAVIAGLAVALAQSGAPPALPDLERRMGAGFEGRQRFCAALDARLPPRPTGEKSVLGDAVTALVKPVLEAVVKLWEMRREDDKLRRDTIRAQMEATRWPDFVASP